MGQLGPLGQIVLVVGFAQAGVHVLLLAGRTAPEALLAVRNRIADTGYRQLGPRLGLADMAELAAQLE